MKEQYEKMENMFDLRDEFDHLRPVCTGSICRFSVEVSLVKVFIIFKQSPFTKLTLD